MEDLCSKNPLVISYTQLRRAVGFLGVLLPLVLLIGAGLIGKQRTILPSISHYYYSNMGDVFVGTLCAVGVFLISYKGYEALDNWSANIAGVCAFGIALFPTSAADAINTRDVDTATEKIHYIFAAIFFLTLAFMAYFLFTKTGGSPTPEKLLRNRVYRACSIIIVGALLLILAYSQLPFLYTRLLSYSPIFFLETLALVAFGVSWIIKGDFMLQDRTP